MKTSHSILEVDWKEIGGRWMRAIISVARYICLFLIGVKITSLLEPVLIPIYKSYYPNSGGGWLDFTGVTIFVYTAVFIIPLLFILLGDKRRYIAVVIYIIPQILFEILTDPFWLSWSFFSSTPIAVCLGIFVGWLIRLIATNTLGKIPSLEPLKRYF